MAFLAGALITIQGVFNAKISEDIGTWQTASLTQFIGFIVTIFLLTIVPDPSWKKLKHVKPLFITGGSFGAIIIFCNITAIIQIGVTLSIAILLIAQLFLTYLIDQNGWFGYLKQRVQIQQLIGIGMMIVGVVILKF